MNSIVIGLVWVFIFTIPWSDMLLFPEIGTISRVLGIPVLVIASVAAIYRKKLRFHRLHAFAFAFVVWSCLSYFWSVNVDITVIRIQSYVQLFFMMWLVYQWAQDLKTTRFFLNAYVLGACVSIAATLIAYSSGVQTVYQRYSAAGYNPNDMAYVLSLAIPMAWYLAMREERRWLVLIYRLYPAFALFAVFLSGSRGGFIVALIALLFVALTYDKLSPSVKTTMVVVGIIAGVFGITLIPLEPLARIQSIGQGLAAGDLNSRLEIWQAGLQILATAPLWGFGVLWGIGAGTFTSAVAIYFGQPIPPHNVYLAILIENGVIGLLIFTAILLLLWFSALKLPKTEKLLWCILLCAWGVAAFVSNWEWRKETWLLFSLLIAHADALRYENDRTMR